MPTTERDESLKAVVYTSTAAEPFDDARLARLLEQSRHANADRAVTGILLYRDGRFLQVVEGPESAVDRLLEVIRSDDRHAGFRIMMEDRGQPRRFSEWTMGYQAWDEAADGMPDGFRRTFDDLDAGEDDRTLSAVRELSRWFRPREESSAVPRW